MTATLQLTTLPMPSPRQMEILTLLPSKLTNAAIGRRLGLDEDTIKSHLRHLSKRWNANGRMEIVLLAFANGYLSPPGKPTPTGVSENARLWRFVYELRDVLGLATAVNATGGSVLDSTLRAVRQMVGAPAVAEASAEEVDDRDW